MPGILGNRDGFGLMGITGFGGASLLFVMTYYEIFCEMFWINNYCVNVIDHTIEHLCTL